MVRVSLNRNLSTQIAELFGPTVTHREAVRIMARAKGIADEAAVGRNPGHSVSNRLKFSTKHHGVDSLVVMDVTGRDGSNVAAHHEFGAYNARTGKRTAGHHVMQRAARGW